MNQDVSRMEKDIANVVFYLNGGLNYTDAYALSNEQLKTLTDVVNDHFEKQNEAYKKASKR
jgi:hypothetical protein